MNSIILEKQVSIITQQIDTINKQKEDLKKKDNLIIAHDCFIKNQKKLLKTGQENLSEKDKEIENLKSKISELEQEIKKLPKKQNETKKTILKSYKFYVTECPNCRLDTELSISEEEIINVHTCIDCNEEFEIKEFVIEDHTK